MPDHPLKINARRLQQLLRKMVNIYSPPGKENDLVDFLYSYLKRHGLPVVRQTVDEDRHNLIVEPDDVEAELVMVGHVDTVEAYDLESYEFGLDGDLATGLGTADMKGGCAAMIELFSPSGKTATPTALWPWLWWWAKRIMVTAPSGWCGNTIFPPPSWVSPRIFCRA